MAQDQGKTFTTVGDLREAIQGLPAETKLGFVGQQQAQTGDVGVGDVEEGDQGLGGISMVHDGDRISFSSVQSQSGGAASERTTTGPS